MKLVSTILLICICFFASASKIEFFEGSSKAAFEKAKEEGKLVFIDFYAVWCKPCKQLEKRTLKNKKLSAYLNKNYINLKVNVDDPDPFLQKIMDGKLRSIPYLAFFSPEQIHLGAVEGYVGANELYDYAVSMVNMPKSKNESANLLLSQKAESIALGLCDDMENFTDLVIKLNESEEGSEQFKKLEKQFEAEVEDAEAILQGLDQKMGDFVHNQFFIDHFGKSLDKHCSETLMVMQLLIE